MEARGEGEGGALGEKEMERQSCHAMNLGLKSLALKGETTDERDELLTTLAPGEECKGWRVVAVKGVAQDEPGTEKVVRGDWKAVAEGMVQARLAPEEVVARPFETPVGGEPRWQKSSSGKEGLHSGS